MLYKKYLIQFKKQLICVLLVLFILILLWVLDRHIWHGKLNIQSDQKSLFVDNNATLNDIIYYLAQEKIIQHPRLMLFVAKRHLKKKSLRYGDYRLQPGMSAAQIFSNIQSGRNQVLYHITFIEGWTYSQMLEKIESSDDLICDTCKIKADQVMATFDSNKKSPEGLFYPDTYSFYKGDKAIVVLRLAYNKMQALLSEQWQARSKDLPYKNSYEALIVASLIESETSLDQERPLVASVIMNRLNKGMRLQIDPTVMYGLGMAPGTLLKRSDLKKCTPHNTYCHAGLPPTPINMPGESSIVAAFHPAKTNYLYYFSKGDGSHKFTTNYNDHLKAIKTYRDDKNKDKSQSASPFSPVKTAINELNYFISWHDCTALMLIPTTGFFSP